MLAGRLDLAELNAIISRRSGLRQTDDAYLVNASHLFVTQPCFVTDPAVLQRGVQTEAVNRCLAQASGSVEAADYRGVPALVVYRWLPDRNLCLIVKMDQAEALGPARAFGGTVAAISAAALLLAGVAAVALARTITRPMLALQAGAARIRQGDFASRLPEQSGDELAELAREFNRMAASLSDKDAELRAYAQTLEQKVQERTTTLQRTNQVLQAEIAERRQAEASLLVALARLHRLEEANIIGLAVAGTGGEIFEANDYYLNMLGYTREEFGLGQVRWMDHTPPEHLAADYRALGELEQSGVCAPY